MIIYLIIEITAGIEKVNPYCALKYARKMVQISDLKYLHCIFVGNL